MQSFSLFIPSKNFCWIKTVQVSNYLNQAVHKRIRNTQSWIEVWVVLKNTITQIDRFEEIQQMLVFAWMTAASRPENCKAKLWISQERPWMVLSKIVCYSASSWSPVHSVSTSRRRQFQILLLLIFSKGKWITSANQKNASTFLPTKYTVQQCHTC